MEPLESKARVVELWVGNFPKDTTQVTLCLTSLLSRMFH